MYDTASGGASSADARCHIEFLFSVPLQTLPKFNLNAKQQRKRYLCLPFIVQYGACSSAAAEPRPLLRRAALHRSRCPFYCLRLAPDTSDLYLIRMDHPFALLPPFRSCACLIFSFFFCRLLWFNCGPKGNLAPFFLWSVLFLNLVGFGDRCAAIWHMHSCGSIRLRDQHRYNWSRAVAIVISVALLGLRGDELQPVWMRSHRFQKQNKAQALVCVYDVLCHLVGPFWDYRLNCLPSLTRSHQARPRPVRSNRPRTVQTRSYLWLFVCDNNRIGGSPGCRSTFRLKTTPVCCLRSRFWEFESPSDAHRLQQDTMRGGFHDSGKLSQQQQSLKLIRQKPLSCRFVVVVVVLQPGDSFLVVCGSNVLETIKTTSCLWGKRV